MTVGSSCVRWASWSGLAALLLAGVACERDSPGPRDTGALAGQLLVLNSGPGTNSLSLCDPRSLEVLRDVAPSALVPNHGVQLGRRLYVTCSGDDRIVVYTLQDSSLQVEATWSLNALDGRHTGEWSYTPWASLPFGGELYTSFSARDEIGALPLVGDSLRAFATGVWPQGLVITGDTLLVACAGFSIQTLLFGQGEVRAHRLPEGTLLWTAPVAANPQRLELGDQGELLVLCTGDYGPRQGELHVLDRHTGQSRWTLPLGDYPGAMVRDGRRLWLAAWGQYDLQPGGTREGLLTRVDLDGRRFDRGPDTPWRVAAGATDLCLADGRLFVSCFAQDQLCVLEGDSLLDCLEIGHGPGALLRLE
jgi:hypothetical protein